MSSLSNFFAFIALCFKKDIKIQIIECLDSAEIKNKGLENELKCFDEIPNFKCKVEGHYMIQKYQIIDEIFKLVWEICKISKEKENSKVITFKQILGEIK